MWRARKLVGLSPTDRRLLAEAALLVGAARLGLWLLPFRMLPGMLDRLARLVVRRASGSFDMTIDIRFRGEDAKTRRREARRLVASSARRISSNSDMRYKRPTSIRVAPERTIWAVAVVSSGVPGATCLTQALAARALLARQGCPAQLRIGVARGAHGQLEAHAWLEIAGQVILGGSIQQRYTPLLNTTTRL